MKQDDLEEKIEDLELHDKDEYEIERIVSAISPEGLKLRRERKTVRYKLYRIKNEVLGGCASPEDADNEFKKIFEDQEKFDGWRFFSETWDVAMDEPYRIVHRVRSSAEEWEELVESKYPKVLPGGKIEYPDIKVRKAVEKEAELQKQKNE